MNAPPPPSSGPGSGAPPDDGSDLFELARVREYVGFVLRAPLRHRRLALASFLAVAALGVTALFVVPIRWQVSGSVLAQRSALMGVLSNPGMNREWDAPTHAAREMLIRRDNLKALCKQTSFVERHLASRAPAVRLRDWIFAKLGRERTNEELLEGILDGLEDRLWVNVSGEGTVTIGFVWSNRELTFQMVQAALQGFIEGRYATEIKMVGETISILEGHDARVQKEISATIAQVEEKARALRIRATPRLTPPPRPHAAPDEELARLESTLAARQRAAADLEEFRRQRLLELQAQLAQQLAVYAPQHPLVVSTRSAIDAASAPSPQIEALRLEIQDLERQVTRRGGRTDPADTVAAAARGEWAQAARLRFEAEDPRLEYERNQLDLLLRQHSQLLERIDAARIEMDTAQAAFKYRYSVVTPPQLPRRPAKPYGLLFIGGGLAGGIALALFLTTAADIRAGRIQERWQVEQQLGLTVLGETRR